MNMKISLIVRLDIVAPFSIAWHISCGKCGGFVDIWLVLLILLLKWTTDSQLGSLGVFIILQKIMLHSRSCSFSLQFLILQNYMWWHRTRNTAQLKHESERVNTLPSFLVKKFFEYVYSHNSRCCCCCFSSRCDDGDEVDVNDDDDATQKSACDVFAAGLRWWFSVPNSLECVVLMLKQHTFAFISICSIYIPSTVIHSAL